MQQQDDTQQSAELRLAFLRHLPKRLETVRKRGLRLCRQGWDINALSLLYREIQTLAGVCGRYGLLDIGERLFSLESFLGDFVARVAIPDVNQTNTFSNRLRELEPLIAQHEHLYGDVVQVPMSAKTVAPIAINGFPLMVTPPADYWKRFASVSAGVAAPARMATRTATVATTPVSATSSAAVTVPLQPVLAAALTPGLSAVKESAPTLLVKAAPAITTTFTPAPADAIAAPRGTEVRKVYHVSDGNPLACEVDQKLETAGYELTILDGVDELTEVLTAFAPHLVIVDAPFLAALEGIGELIKTARTRLSHRVTLLAFSTSGDLPVRLHAMRAGADAFIALPAQSGDVMARIAELLEVDSTDPYRILIVEDDRSQAIFAESILRKAGMVTSAVIDPLAALDQLDAFKPDLILMDLYMPNCDGMELTSIIREREAFISTPIVFLSGEHDQEKHFAALNAGGDDFLSKPIRPKHLIAAVTNRVRRARQLGRRNVVHNPRDPVTGLYDRAYLLDQLNALLAHDDLAEHGGGLLYAEIDAPSQIRERFGLTAFDALLGQVGAFIASHIPTKDLAARYSDTSFVLLSKVGDNNALKSLANDLRERTSHEVFTLEGKTLTLGLSWGICSFAAGLGEAGAMLNAAERVMADARAPGAGHVGVFQTAQKSIREPAERALVDLIRTALKADDFQLLFQPIVTLQGKDQEQFQTLLRLRGDNGTLYAASEIVPVAEREGLMGDVDRWLLSRCLLVLQERARQQRSLRLFVSQSVEAARDPQRVSWLKQLLETRRLTGEQLALEFRLNEVLVNLRDMTGFALALKEIGVSFALAGFEASLSAFQLLEQLPVDFIKLAPRYVGAGLRDTATYEELLQIVGYAHERDKKVIAPHLEDAQSAAVLWTAGVDFIQGDFVQQAGHDLSYDFHAATL